VQRGCTFSHLAPWSLASCQFALELKPSHKICRKYAAVGVEAGVQDWGVGTVLYGSVKEW
jgi:hypothetical protein